MINGLWMSANSDIIEDPMRLRELIFTWLANPTLISLLLGIGAGGFGQALPADLADDRVLLDAGAIAPLHIACALASLQRCPHLGGMADRDLKAFPPAWIVAPLYVQARRAVTGQAVAAVSFLQLIGVTNDRDPVWRDRLAPG